MDRTLIAAMLVVMAVVMTACRSEHDCPQYLSRAFYVVTTDATNGALVCDTEVVARDGDFEFRSQVECYPRGPAERPGHYAVTISRPGYLPEHREVDTGELDSCGHLDQVRLDVALVRDPKMPPPDGGGPPVP